MVDTGCAPTLAIPPTRRLQSAALVCSTGGLLKNRVQQWISRVPHGKRGIWCRRSPWRRSGQGNNVFRRVGMSVDLHPRGGWLLACQSQDLGASTRPNRRLSGPSRGCNAAAAAPGGRKGGQALAAAASAGATGNECRWVHPRTGVWACPDALMDAKLRRRVCGRPRDSQRLRGDSQGLRSRHCASRDRLHVTRDATQQLQQRIEKMGQLRSTRGPSSALGGVAAQPSASRARATASEPGHAGPFRRAVLLRRGLRLLWGLAYLLRHLLHHLRYRCAPCIVRRPDAGIRQGAQCGGRRHVWRTSRHPIRHVSALGRHARRRGVW